MRVEAPHEMLFDLTPPCLVKWEGRLDLLRLEDLCDALRSRWRSGNKHSSVEVSLERTVLVVVLEVEEAWRKRGEGRGWKRALRRRMEGRKTGEGWGWRTTVNRRKGRKRRRMKWRGEVATASSSFVVRGWLCLRRGDGRRGEEEGSRGRRRGEGKDGRDLCEGRAGHRAERGVGEGALCHGRGVGGISRAQGAVAR